MNTSFLKHGEKGTPHHGDITGGSKYRKPIHQHSGHEILMSKTTTDTTSDDSNGKSNRKQRGIRKNRRGRDTPINTVKQNQKKATEKHIENMERGKKKRSKEAAKSMENLPAEQTHTKTSTSKLTAEQKAKNTARRMDTTVMTIEEIRNVQITGTVIEDRKRRVITTPPRPGFKYKTMEPAKKKAQPEQEDTPQKRATWTSLIEIRGIQENMTCLTNIKDNTLHFIGPLSWIVAAGADIHRYACTLRYLIEDRKVDWNNLKNLPEEMKRQTPNCRNNTTPPEHRFKESFELLKKNIGTPMSDQINEFLTKYRPLIYNDIDDQSLDKSLFYRFYNDICQISNDKCKRHGRRPQACHSL